MTQNYSILVNSSDGYEDCWTPFFYLLSKYWPACQAKIYLNTESKEWTTPIYPELICTQIEKKYNRRLTWSECLLAALDQVDTPLVLYFQEDYFIHQMVDNEKITLAVEYMLNHPEVGHIALTKHCSYGPYEPHSESWLQTIRQNARYRISTQAALWRVDTLSSYLLPEENGWMFEILGTWRAKKTRDIFLCAKWNDGVNSPVIEYLHTGIIKGKWLKEITYIFEKNNISIDYKIRGFYEPKSRLLHKLEVVQKILQKPVHVLNQLFKLCCDRR